MTKPAQDKSDWPTDQEQDEFDESIAEYMSSGQFNADVKADHFADGVPISYIPEDEPGVIVTEYPDGRIERELIKGE